MEKERIEKKIEALAIENATKKNPKDKLEEYLSATKTFEELVNKGLAKKRGFNLMSIDKKNEYFTSKYLLNNF